MANGVTRANYGKLTYARRGSLNAQIKAAALAYGQGAKAIVIDAMFYMGTEVKSHTPYRTGRASAHWRLALNGRPGGYDPEAREPRGMVIDTGPIEGFQLGDNVHLYNKAPYTFLLEEGWSRLADPGQMLRQQVARFAEFMAKAEEDNA